MYADWRTNSELNFWSSLIHLCSQLNWTVRILHILELVHELRYFFERWRNRNRLWDFKEYEVIGDRLKTWGGLTRAIRWTYWCSILQYVSRSVLCFQFSHKHNPCIIILSFNSNLCEPIIQISLMLAISSILNKLSY